MDCNVDSLLRHSFSFLVKSFIRASDGDGAYVVLEIMIHSLEDYSPTKRDDKNLGRHSGHLPCTHYQSRSRISPYIIRDCLGESGFILNPSK